MDFESPFTMRVEKTLWFFNGHERLINFFNQFTAFCNDRLFHHFHLNSVNSRRYVQWAIIQLILLLLACPLDQNQSLFYLSAFKLNTCLRAQRVFTGSKWMSSKQTDVDISVKLHNDTNIIKHLCRSVQSDLIDFFCGSKFKLTWNKTPVMTTRNWSSK